MTDHVIPQGPLPAQRRATAPPAAGINTNIAPSMKLDPAWSYRVLKQEFRFLRRLSDKQQLEALADEVRRGRSLAVRRVEALIERERGSGSVHADKSREDRSLR